MSETIRDIDDTKIVNDQIAMLPDNVSFTGVAGSKGLKTMGRWLVINLPKKSLQKGETLIV